MENNCIKWEQCRSTEDWLRSQKHNTWKDTFDNNGYLVIDDILNEVEVSIYRSLYDRFLSGEIKANSHRHDLGSHAEKRVETAENICQIMWPSKFVPNLQQGPFHQRALKCCRVVLGDDLEFDFDMLICKAPFTDTITPWHQDESYWLDLPDKRAVSVWLSLDKATIDNGCMQFVSGSHKHQVRPHKPAGEGHHALCCEASESEFTPAPLPPGGCTLHHGRTIHYTRGNKTASYRRAMIMNARPGSMIKMERERGFDHGKDQGVDTILGEGQGHENKDGIS